MLKKGDKVLIAVAAVLGVLALAWFALGGAAPSDGAVVVCQTKDGFRRVDPLDKDVSYTVESGSADSERGYNVVTIHGGSVDVTEADCSNQVCVDHDPISKPGEQIVCLPHGMVVEVVEQEEDAAELL